MTQAEFCLIYCGRKLTIVGKEPRAIVDKYMLSESENFSVEDLIEHLDRGQVLALRKGDNSSPCPFELDNDIRKQLLEYCKRHCKKCYFVEPSFVNPKDTHDQKSFSSFLSQKTENLGNNFKFFSIYDTTLVAAWSVRNYEEDKPKVVTVYGNYGSRKTRSTYYCSYKSDEKKVYLIYTSYSEFRGDPEEDSISSDDIYHFYSDFMLKEPGNTGIREVQRRFLEKGDFLSENSWPNNSETYGRCIDIYKDILLDSGVGFLDNIEIFIREESQLLTQQVVPLFGQKHTINLKPVEKCGYVKDFWLEKDGDKFNNFYVINWRSSVCSHNRVKYDRERHDVIPCRIESSVEIRREVDSRTGKLSLENETDSTYVYKCHDSLINGNKDQDRYSLHIECCNKDNKSTIFDIDNVFSAAFRDEGMKALQNRENCGMIRVQGPDKYNYISAFEFVQQVTECCFKTS